MCLNQDLVKVGFTILSERFRHQFNCFEINMRNRLKRFRKNPLQPPGSPGLFGTLKSGNEILGILIGIATSVTLILKQFNYSILADDQFLIAVDILNIFVLLLALSYIQPTALSIEASEFSKLKRHLKLNAEDDYKAISIRVNSLIKQLVSCIRWFIIILGFFYMLQLFTDYQPVKYKCDETSKECVEEVIKDKNNPDMVYLLSSECKNPFCLQSAKYLSVEILTNSTNLFSASYLFIAFQVLFLVTLEDDNKTWKLKSYISIAVALLITGLNILCFIWGIKGESLLTISHIMRLAGGVYNGMAMFLLFSRFISMEYFFKSSNSGWQRNFYLYGTVVVLPLYVISQPLYGLFNAVEIGKSPELFKAIVFLICFWGKLVFLLFIFTMLTKKWIHSYLFMVLSQKDSLLNISRDLSDVDDFIEHSPNLSKGNGLR